MRNCATSFLCVQNVVRLWFQTCFIFTPHLWEMIQFEEPIFEMGQLGCWFLTGVSSFGKHPFWRPDDPQAGFFSWDGIFCQSWIFRWVPKKSGKTPKMDGLFIMEKPCENGWFLEGKPTIFGNIPFVRMLFEKRGGEPWALTSNLVEIASVKQLVKVCVNLQEEHMDLMYNH